MSSRKMRRKINGILLLDKPLGLTSNDALTKVKNIFQAEKAGHTGSLDPLASGMLPICFGEATKFSQFLLEADKEYLVTAELGIRTTTGDREGEVVATKPVAVTHLLLTTVLESFKGEIDQVPSMYSALKHKGRPLYSYARQGIEIDRPSRKVFIRAMELIDFKDNYFTILVRCSKGTYIRTLIEDIGEQLGCGALVDSLKRNYVDPYVSDPMITIEKLEEMRASDLPMEAGLLSIDTALLAWPQVSLNSSMAFYLTQGQSIIVSGAPPSGYVRLYSDQTQFLGVGEITAEGKVAPKRLIAA